MTVNTGSGDKPFPLVTNAEKPGAENVELRHLQTRPPTDYRARIEKVAYSLAERRGFAPGHELEDWLDAEKQVQFQVLGEGRTF